MDAPLDSEYFRNIKPSYPQGDTIEKSITTISEEATKVSNAFVEIEFSLNATPLDKFFTVLLERLRR